MIEQEINLDDSIALARRYFTPGAESFWIWADDGQTIQWRSGATIAFRQELLAVLSRLVPTGWPSLGALLLLLSACRDSWMDSDGGRAAMVEHARAFGPIGILAPHQQHQADKRGWIIFGLDFVKKLPPELRRSTDAKSIVAETVFETTNKQLTPEESAAAMRAMSAGLSSEMLAAREEVFDPWARFSSEVDALCDGLEKVSPERLALRGRTGLDAEVKPASIEYSPSDRVRALLQELRDDRELAGLASLAGNLMAAVHVPRTLHSRDELPLGGVSDLSNRGPLDRLLVSELAHDDQTLAIRIALNEAMYLRRESPPKNPPQRRAILIDCGIRTWGVPRVFATAAALALAATADKDCELFTLRARRDGIAPVDLTTRAGLVSHQEALETPPHPGSAIAPFFDALRESTNSACDAILVTHEDVLADVDFIRHCLGQENLDWHIATVSRDGAFRLFHQNRAGRRLVCQATMSLDQISPPAEPARPITPLLSPVINPKLPLILSTRPFPILLPQTLEPRLAGVSRHGLIGITKDGRLMHWRRDHRSGWQLSDVVPRGRVHGIVFFDSEPLALAVIQSARAGNVVMVAVNLASGKCGTAVLKTTEPHPIAIALRGDLLMLIYRSAVDAFNARTGDFLGKMTIPAGISWNNGRFFQGNGAFHAIAFDGTKLWLEKLPPTSRGVLRVFDCHEMDGPISLLRDGQIDTPVQWRLRPVAAPFSIIKRVVGISPDGARIIVNSWEGAAPANFLLDLRNNDGWKRAYGDPAEALLAPTIHRSTRSGVTLRHNFQAIWATAAGELALLSKKDHVVVIGLNYQGHMLLLDRGRLGPMDGKPLRFLPAAGPRGTRYELGVANFKDGSRAWLDSRGLLHLKSSDPKLPEISLILSNGPMAGWSSDFERFGDDFFFDAAPTSTAAAFAEAIRAFLARVR